MYKFIGHYNVVVITLEDTLKYLNVFFISHIFFLFSILTGVCLIEQMQSYLI